MLSMPETPETAASPEDITADLPVEPPAAELEPVDVELGDAAEGEAEAPQPPASLASDPDDDQLVED